jgi:exonuclease VII small subunit
MQDRIEQQLQAATERLQQLLQEGANWRVRLEYGLTDLKKEIIGHEFEEGASAVKNRFDGYLREDKYMSRPASVVDAVRSDVSALSSRLFKKMLEQCEKLQGELESSTAVSLRAYNAGPLTLDLGQPNLSGGPERREGVWRKTLEVGRQASFSGTSGGLIGGVLGGIVGGAMGLFAGGVGALAGAQVGAQIGAAIGSLAGMGTGVRKGVEQINEQEKEAARRAIRSTVAPFLNDALRFCRTELDRSFTGMERSMSAEFVNKLSQEKRSLERSLKAFQDTRQLTHAQAGERLRALRGSLQEIDALLHEGELLATTVLDAGGSARAAVPLEDAADYGDFADA